MIKAVYTTNQAAATQGHHLRIFKSPSTCRALTRLSLQTGMPTELEQLSGCPAPPGKGQEGLSSCPLCSLTVLTPQRKRQLNPTCFQQRWPQEAGKTQTQALPSGKANPGGRGQLILPGLLCKLSQGDSSALNTRKTALLCGCRLTQLVQECLDRMPQNTEETKSQSAHLPTSTQKSPRMVPGMDSAGLVSPIIVRTVLTTSRPCQTYVTAKQESASTAPPAGQIACPPISLSG